jgi:hypothetical protein
MGGARILVAMLDSGQDIRGLVLKALITKEHHLYDMCANVSRLGVSIRSSPTELKFDVLFIEFFERPFIERGKLSASCCINLPPVLVPPP